MSLTILALCIILYLILTWTFITFAIYFIPTIVAYIRKHNNIFAITVLNIMFGWTFIGWLAALLWALNSDIKETIES